MESFGIVYVVSGKKKYLYEAINSATTIKKLHPNFHITCFSTIHINNNVFDKLVIIEDGNPFKVKANNIHKSPYENTLFLDSDTTVEKPLDNILNEFKHYDVMMASEPVKKVTPTHIRKRTFATMEDLNTGMIFFKSSFKPHLKKWGEHISKKDDSEVKMNVYADQEAFKELYFKTLFSNSLPGIKFKLLDNTIYNVRPWIIPALKTLNLFDKIVIKHDYVYYPSIAHKLIEYIWVKFLIVKNKLSKKNKTTSLQRNSPIP